MRIAILSFYNGQIDRGVEVAVEALARGFSKNHQVTIFQAGDRKGINVNTKILNTECDWRQDTSESVWRNWYLDYYSRKITLFTLKFIPYLIKFKYDLVIPTNGGWQVLICRLVTWLLRKKIIVQGNAGIGRDDLWQLMCFPDHFIAISPQGFDWVKNMFPWIKKSHISYGVNADQIRKAVPQKVPLSKPIVLCVSAFLPYKQIDLIIKAISLLQNVRFLLIGQGPQKEYLQKLGSDLLGDRFLMLGGITHDQLPGYYRAVDLFTLASKSSEALGIVYIEAMAAGLPIVAPDDNNRRRIIGEYGFYTDVNNPEQYAAVIKKALEVKNSREMIHQAEKYSWNIIVSQYENLFKNL